MQCESPNCQSKAKDQTDKGVWLCSKHFLNWKNAWIRLKKRMGYVKKEKPIIGIQRLRIREKLYS